ncbi:hypothetical protein [Marinobacter shengliensis]|uniref:Uncharacterized protein n=1 Tax=Marinobacter shengliensis TaxID=1389223 RepID=A0ABV4W916_9GAMM
MHYYLIGTFTEAPHPYRKTSQAKHNPLQTLAYLFFKLVISPVIWASAHVYMATMDKSLMSPIKPMITGYEDLEDQHYLVIIFFNGITLDLFWW